MAACIADLNGDHNVDGNDLTSVLSQWGTNGTADFSQDQNVGGEDLTILLSAWGACP